MDYKSLLVKYVCHVGAAEGIDFATNANLSPAGMGDLEFTEDERNTLVSDIFPQAIRVYSEPSAIVHSEMCIGGNKGPCNCRAAQQSHAGDGATPSGAEGQTVSGSPSSEAGITNPPRP